MEKQIEETKETFDVWICQNNNFPNGVIPERYFFSKEGIAQEFCTKNPEFIIQKASVEGVIENPSKIAEFFTFSIDQFNKEELSVHLFKDMTEIFKKMSSFPSLFGKSNSIKFRNQKKEAINDGAFLLHHYSGFFMGLEQKIQSTSERNNFEEQYYQIRNTYQAYDYFFIKPKYFEVVKNWLNYNPPYFNWKYQTEINTRNEFASNYTINSDIWMCYGITNKAVLDFYFDSEVTAEKFLKRYPKMTLKKFNVNGKLHSPNKIARIIYQKFNGDLIIGVEPNFKELMKKHQEDIDKYFSSGGAYDFDPYVDIYDRAYYQHSSNSGGGKFFSFFKFLKFGRAYIHKNHYVRNKDTEMCDSLFVEEKVTPELELPDQKMLIRKEIEIFIKSYCEQNNKAMSEIPMEEYLALVLNHYKNTKHLPTIRESVIIALHDRIKIDYDKSD